MRLSTKPPNHPDEYHGRVGKPQSTPGQDLAWIEAINTPDARHTDNFLRRSLKDLESWNSKAHAVLSRIYLAGNADESLPEQWRKFAANTQNPLAKRMQKLIDLHLLDDAFGFVLYRAHLKRELLIWPSPERAKKMAKTNDAKKREARYHYVEARERGEPVTACVRTAFLSAHCSETAVWSWRQEEGWEDMVSVEARQANATSKRCPECGQPELNHRARVEA